jgi:chromate transporter
MKQLSQLARVFGSLSLLSVGGGMAAYPELKRLTVDTHGWLALTQLDYLWGIGQAAPGPNMMMIISVGTLVAGVLGAIVVFIAFFTPTTVLTLLVGRLWGRLSSHPVFVAIQRALAPVSVGLFLAGCLTFAKGAVNGWIAAAIAAVVFATLLRTKISPALLILAGALAGLLAFSRA